MLTIGATIPAGDAKFAGLQPKELRQTSLHLWRLTEDAPSHERRLPWRIGEDGLDGYDERPSATLAIPERSANVWPGWLWREKGRLLIAVNDGSSRGQTTVWDITDALRGETGSW